MKIKKSLAVAVLVLAVSGGGVAVAASMASANAPVPAAPRGPAAVTTGPEIGAVGRTGDKPPAGVTVRKGQAAKPAK